MRPPDKACGARGVALVETLASLVVVAMISLMIIQGLAVARSAWNRQEVRQGAGETIDAAQAQLRERLEETYPKTLYDINPEDVDFHGAHDRLVFVANPPEANRPSALRRYDLGVDAAGRLVLASASDVDPQVVSSAERLTLLSGVRALDIAYFGAAPPDQVRQWRSTWDLRPASPELVRIRVVFAPGDPRRWPDLIVHPRATVDAACVIDINVHRCRGRA